MTKDEYLEAKALVEEIRGGDVRLGRVLHTMLDHLADAHGVNKAPDEPKAPEEPPKKSKAEE